MFRQAQLDESDAESEVIGVFHHELTSDETIVPPSWTDQQGAAYHEPGSAGEQEFRQQPEERQEIPSNTKPKTTEPHRAQQKKASSSSKPKQSAPAKHARKRAAVSSSGTGIGRSTDEAGRDIASQLMFDSSAVPAKKSRSTVPSDVNSSSDLAGEYLLSDLQDL